MITLTLKVNLHAPLEAEAITPDNFLEKSAAEIARLHVTYGNEASDLGDFFRIEGEASADITLIGDLSRAKSIGAGMTRGTVTVNGNVGMHLGAGMRGGEIHAYGNAGDWAGAEMAGGNIHIRGNAGHGLGGAYRGSRHGMNRGIIVVEGNAGNEAGAVMRRGLIAILGDAGDFAGAFMIAGSMVVFRKPGARAGAGMLRGTIVTFEEPQLLPTYRYDCVYQPIFLRLVLQSLKRRGLSIPDEYISGSYRRYSGDLNRLGKEKSWSMISLNERARAIVGQMIEECEALGVDVRRLANGAIVIDSGIGAPGSLEAGRLFSEACLGGLGKVGFAQRTYHGRTSGESSSYWLPAVTVNVSAPHLACMASQYAGWAVKHHDYFAMGSGPARALFAEEDIFQKLEYEDRSDTAVLMLESRQLPDENVAHFIAEKCKVKPDCLMLLVAPTASIVGSVQIAARSSETGLHKLTELGFDVRQVKTSLGLCPLAPVASDDLRAIGRTNDAILYGSQVFYSVQAEDDELEALIGRIPSSGSSDYGTPFYDLFQRYNGDFYQIDPMLFSPAQVEINNLASGHTFRAGQLNTAILQSSLLEG